jgi:thioredoxin reductase (NADPH)
VEEAAFLTRYGSRVYVIHRRDTFRAQPIIQEQLEASGKAEKVLNTVVEEIVGEEGKVHHLVLRNTETDERSELEVGAVFPFIGFIPHSDVFRDPVELDQGGYIKTDERMETSVPGVFAAGDVRAQYVRQISNAVGDATTAALAAGAYVERLKHERSKQAV